MKERIVRFWKEKGWQKMKKSDWAVLALIGVLLLILAVPTERQSSQNALPTEETETKVTALEEETDSEQTYAEEMEEKLQQILADMEGVGEVKVMITVEDTGEKVVEKDEKSTVSTTTESDGDGGTRTVTEGEETQETRYVELSGEQYPYIKKEKLPTVTGVVVVAEGAGNPTVVSNISKAVEALFPVEAHKIMVVKMSSKEDGK